MQIGSDALYQLCILIHTCCACMLRYKQSIRITLGVLSTHGVATFFLNDASEVDRHAHV